MTELTVTVPDAVYRGIHDLSQREKIPLDQLVALALNKKLSATMTEDYLQKRTARGSREKFLAGWWCNKNDFRKKIDSINNLKKEIQ